MGRPHTRMNWQSTFSRTYSPEIWRCNRKVWTIKATISLWWFTRNINIKSRQIEYLWPKIANPGINAIFKKFTKRMLWGINDFKENRYHEKSSYKITVSYAFLTYYSHFFWCQLFCFYFIEFIMHHHLCHIQRSMYLRALYFVQWNTYSFFLFTFDT